MVSEFVFDWRMDSEFAQRSGRICTSRQPSVESLHVLYFAQDSIEISSEKAYIVKIGDLLVIGQRIVLYIIL